MVVVAVGLALSVICILRMITNARPLNHMFGGGGRKNKQKSVEERRKLELRNVCNFSEDSELKGRIWDHDPTDLTYYLLDDRILMENVVK